MWQGRSTSRFVQERRVVVLCLYRGLNYPELSTEVDISLPTIDRPGIPATLRVSEVWRYDGNTRQVIIERLGEDGRYHQVDESGLLPIRAENVWRWVVVENSDDRSQWATHPRAWVQAELAA
jgi:hypothetical protein